MKYGEGFLLSTRSISNRLVESVLLVVAIALGIGAAGAGVAMMTGTALRSRKLLDLPEYREIVVSTRSDAEEMDLPAIAVNDANNDVVLTTIDLKAAEEAPDVHYAYVANRRRFHLGDFRFGPGSSSSQNTETAAADSGSPDAADSGTTRQNFRFLQFGELGADAQIRRIGRLRSQPGILCGKRHACR